jgi:hypothetical protein
MIIISREKKYSSEIISIKSQTSQASEIHACNLTTWETAVRKITFGGQPGQIV